MENVSKAEENNYIKDEKIRRKRDIKVVNCDFLEDLPGAIRGVVYDIKLYYQQEPWFDEAWEKYRKHVLDAGLGGKIKMPGFVFNEYIDKFVDDNRKRLISNYFLHSDCDIDELCHYGIKGQKWGVRRFEDDEGHLTEAGKDRYLDAYEKRNKKLDKEEKKATKKTERKAALKLVAAAAGVAVGIALYKKLKNRAGASPSTSEEPKVTILGGSTKSSGAKAAAGLGKTIIDAEFVDVTPSSSTISLPSSYLPALVKHANIGGEWLEHHGIKNQKWGVRRYQNEDGSLTPEGRKRYLKNPSNISYNKQGVKEYLKDKLSSKKPAENQNGEQKKKLTDEEYNKKLKLMIEKEQLERQLEDEIRFKGLNQRLSQRRLENDIRAAETKRYETIGKQQTRQTIQDMGLVAGVLAGFTNVALNIKKIFNKNQDDDKGKDGKKDKGKS